MGYLARAPVMVHDRGWSHGSTKFQSVRERSQLEEISRVSLPKSDLVTCNLHGLIFEASKGSPTLKPDTCAMTPMLILG